MLLRCIEPRRQRSCTRRVRHSRGRFCAGLKVAGKSGEITKAQHRRAEFYSQTAGWVPVDPADVRKVILEEEGGKEDRRSQGGGCAQVPVGQLGNELARVELRARCGIAGIKSKLGFFMYPNGNR